MRILLVEDETVRRGPSNKGFVVDQTHEGVQGVSPGEIPVSVWPSAALRAEIASWRSSTRTSVADFHDAVTWLPDGIRDAGGCDFTRISGVMVGQS